MDQKVLCSVAGYIVECVPGTLYTLGCGGNCWGPIPLAEVTEIDDVEGIFKATPITYKNQYVVKNWVYIGPLLPVHVGNMHMGRGRVCSSCEESHEEHKKIQVGKASFHASATGWVAEVEDNNGKSVFMAGSGHECGGFFYAYKLNPSTGEVSSVGWIEIIIPA